MKATEIKAGQKFEFTPTNVVFEIANVTDKRISWYTGHAHKSGWGVNTMRMAWTSIKRFQSGIDNGTYIVK
jgi:hypothetical protein